jgi:thiol-disulfide isomerase/thioredoxin
MFRNRRNRYAVLVFLRLLAIVLIVFCFGWRASQASGPEATALDLSGKPIDPFRVSSGKAVVLVFVRTDCPISNRYAPTIQKLATEYSGKATFWLIYPGKTTAAAAIAQNLREYGYKLPALRDPQHELVKLSGVQVTPEVAVFDTGGRLAYHGRIDNWYQDFGHARSAPSTHELGDAIEAVLNGRAPQVATAAGVGCYISDLE